MPTEFITIKLSKNTFENLKKYRNIHNLKSMSIVVENGIDCLNSTIVQKKKLKYCKMQEIIIDELIGNTMKNWATTVDINKIDKSIEDALQSFNEIRQKLKNDNEDIEIADIEIIDEILNDVLNKYISIMYKTIKEIKMEKKEDNDEIIIKYLEKFIATLIFFNKSGKNFPDEDVITLKKLQDYEN